MFPVIQTIHSSEALEEDVINRITQNMNLAPKDNEPGQCLSNAILVAKTVENAVCIEGFTCAILEHDGQVHHAVLKHAWNELDGKFFDLTKEAGKTPTACQQGEQGSVG